MADRSPDENKSGRLQKGILLAAALSALVFAAPAARAQIFNRPPADVEDQAPRSDEANNLVRVDRLESQVRSLNGQVEQLQFQIKRLEDQMRKFQMDVDARFQEGAGRGGPRPAPQKRTDAPEIEPPVGAPQQAAQLPPAAAPAVAPVGVDGRRHDAFDPAVQPAAPGSPQALGSPESASRPVERLPGQGRDPNGPLDLSPPGLRDQGAVAASPAASAVSSPVASFEPAAAATPIDPVKADYEAATEQLKSQHYDAAQQAFSAFVQKNGRSRLIAPAIYHLGESYYYQNRHREAAEQFLKIATDYSKSSVAPDAMIKLGVSLSALGAKEQACAFFSELPRKYPNASAAEKTAAAREAKKASC